MSYRTDQMRQGDPLYLFESDRRERTAMEEGSRQLLKALWREHPAIMRRQFIVGRAEGRP